MSCVLKHKWGASMRGAHILEMEKSTVSVRGRVSSNAFNSNLDNK